MRKFRRGDRVVLRAPLRRGRRHKYGPARLRRGKAGKVVRRHQRLLKSPRYDVDFSRRHPGRSVRVVPKVPAASLRRPRPLLPALLLVLTLLLIISYLG